MIYEYKANGQVVSRSMLEAAGMGDTYLWLKPGGKAELYLFNQSVDAAGAPGVYTISGFNSSGFSAPDAEAKYLDEVKAEAREADKAAAANMKTKELAVDVSSGVGSNKMTVTVSMQIPESGWAYDEKKNSLINNDNIKASGAGFIQFTVEKEIEKFDFYKDKFENYQEIGEREIGGVTFQGRTYKRIGYEWTEYIAQIEEGKAVSIGIVKADISEGTAGDRILNSIQFK